MRVYHATKKEEAYERILKDRLLLPGRNLATEAPLVHVSLRPFTQGSYALDVIGADTNEAWILECEILGETPLADDPTDEAGECYNGGWRVCETPISITRIHSVTYISNVQKWERGDSGYAEKIPARNR